MSHLDIYETLLSLLSAYKIKIPDVSAALGNKLNIDESDRDVKIAFMDDNRDIVDYLSDNFFLSGEQLFKVNKDLSLTLLNDNIIKAKLQRDLELFKKISLHVSCDDKILPDSLYCKSLGYNLIYSQHSTDSVKFSTEYYNIINSTKIANKTFHYDISLKYPSFPDKDFSLVYQLSTKNDSIILWRNTGITNENKKFQVHLEIPKQNVLDSIIYFKSYFWNKNKKEFNLNNFKVLIYQK